MFTEKQYYHVYNQGNNRRKLFFTDADYELFLFKSISYISPFAEIVAYCLMPNHYHFMLFVNELTMSRNRLKRKIEEIQKQYVIEKGLFWRLNPIRIDSNSPSEVSIPEAISIIQRSYTRSINNKKNWTGSMFRHQYKIKDGWTDQFTTVEDGKFFFGNDYVIKCIDYIHQNPVRANLCKKPEEWKYSSAKEKLKV